MEQQSETQQKEISIREIIETLFKGKFIIAIIMAIALVLSGVVSFFMIPNTYQAKTVLQTTPIDFQSTKFETAEGDLINYLTRLPNLTIETYRQQLVSPEVLDNTIKAADLRDEAGNYISAGTLAGSIAVSIIAGTNLIEIRVSNQDPAKAALIANTLGQSYIQYMTANTRKLGQQSVNLIAEQLTIEEKNLDDKSKALAEFWKKNGNIDALKIEIESLVKQMSEYNEDLRDTETQIVTDTQTLQVLLGAVGSTSGISLDDFNVIIDSSAETQDIQLNLNSDALSESLLRIDINKIQTRLVSNTYKKQALEDTGEKMKLQLTEIQIQLTEQEYKYNALNRDLEMAKQSYDAYQQKYKEYMLTVAADIGKASIIVSSPAIVPASPVSPNRMMNLIVALFLGLLLGVFIVLFRDYWRKSKTKI